MCVCVCGCWELMFGHKYDAVANIILATKGLTKMLDYHKTNALSLSFDFQKRETTFSSHSTHGNHGSNPVN